MLIHFVKLVMKDVQWKYETCLFMDKCLVLNTLDDLLFGLGLCGYYIVNLSLVLMHASVCTLRLIVLVKLSYIAVGSHM